MIKWFFVFYMTCFAALSSTDEVSPVFGNVKIRNEHVEDIRKIIIEDFVSRVSNSDLLDGGGSLGTSEIRFSTIHFNSAGLDARVNANAATFAQSDEFTLSFTGDVSEQQLASVDIQTFGGPVLLLLQPTSTSASVTANPTNGIQCERTGATCGAELIFKRNGTAINNLNFLYGETSTNPKMHLPTSMFKTIDTPPSGTHTYTLHYKLNNASTTLSIGQSHKFTAVRL